jgi:phosphatidylserine/phosphatidylglycerophosphate/cardiolipin synthase-like enzyme
MRLPLGSLGGEAVFLSDSDYVPFALRAFGASRIRILASVFIIDPRVGDSPVPNVYNLLIACRDAMGLGADVRILIGGSRRNHQIGASAQLAWDLCRALGLDSRWLTAMETRGSHMKLVVADDTVIVGSHNWSAGAFGGQSQESIAIRSPSLAAVCAGTFENQWNRSEHASHS